jgi:hypothetical protein
MRSLFDPLLSGFTIGPPMAHVLAQVSHNGKFRHAGLDKDVSQPVMGLPIRRANLTHSEGFHPFFRHDDNSLPNGI